MSFPTMNTNPREQKFQFDDFDAIEQIDVGFDEPAVEQSYTAEDVSRIRAEAEAAGHRRGVEETQAALDGEIAQLLTRIAEDTANALREQQDQRSYIAAEAVRLSTVIARRVLPASAEAGALLEIETLVARCLNERPEESRIVVRLNDALMDPIRKKMDQLIDESGFGAKPVLLADPALRRAEIRIEWANGGVDWNFDAQLADIEAAARRLTARPGKLVAKPVLNDTEAKVFASDEFKETDQ